MGTHLSFVGKPTRVHVLGPFNSGSSFAQQLLTANEVPLSDLEFQQALFKHYPADLLVEVIRRLQLDCSSVLFVAVVRDPGAWIEAMHREPYEMVFDGTDGPCRLDSAASNFHRSYREHLAGLGLSEAEINAHLSFGNLVECWQTIYRGYIELAQAMPLTIVRYEDLLENTAREVLAIRDVVGLPRPEIVKIPLPPAKPHGHPRDYLEARTKLEALKTDRPYRDLVKDRLSPDLLATLGYGVEAMPTPTSH